MKIPIFLCPMRNMKKTPWQMKPSPPQLTVLLISALLQLEITAGNQTALVGEYGDLQIPTCWRNELFRSDVLPSGASGLSVISDFLVGVIENFREDMANGLPDLKIPVLDPFQLPDAIVIDVDDEMASVHGNFRELAVRGLSNFSMGHLNANLYDLSLTFSLRLPRIYANGRYVINGKIMKIFPLRGNGTFWIESKNLSLSAAASMESTDNGYLQLANDFDVCIDFDAVRMDFENLLGGGKWTEVLKKILNDMSTDLFKKYLPFIKGEFKRDLLKVINNHLMKLPIKNVMPGSTANEYVDQILSDVRQRIQEGNYDPMKLPDYYKSFSKEVLSARVHGEARLYDGWLSGLSSIHRTGECALNSSSETIALSAYLGLRNLRINYKGHSKFMNWGPSIECGGKVSRVSFFISVEQSNIRGSTPHLRDFKIVKISTMYVELSGLGPLPWMTKWILTGVFKLMENVLVNKVTEHLKRYLEEEFQKVSFPW